MFPPTTPLVHIELKGLFIHEMVHVWQKQSGINVMARRGIFPSYGSTLKDGRKFEHYGIEQQANIVMEYFYAREEYFSRYPLSQYKSILPFIQVK